MEKQREEKMETRVKPGDFVPNGFSYPNNATVQNDFLYLRDENGNIIDGKVTVGDRITVLKVLENKKLALVQYPVGAKVKEGYVTNATNIIKYDNLEKWVNKASKTNIYEDANTGSQRLGSVDPNEKATFLYRKNNMDNIVYNASGGTRNKSGFADLNGSSGGSGSNGVDPWPNVAPGSIVSGGFTFPNNAKVIAGSLQLMDANKNPVSGTVTKDDLITVLDVGHSKQLALVQYPTSNGVKQGYIHNDLSKIRYNSEYDWYNGASPEYVYSKYNSGDSGFGKLAARESATKLYEYGGRVHIVYDTPTGMLSKSGYVNYKGRTVPARQHLDLGAIGHKNARLKVYGKSGNGYNLNAYRLGATDQSGKKIKKLFLGFAIHGWEDHWKFDGEALVKIGSSVLNKLGNYISTNGDLNGWQVCIAPCMNPDGLIAGRTSYGPGRCAVTTGIDLNRCFPTGFSAIDINTPRYYTGKNWLGAPEAVALKNLVTELSSESSELMVVDCHGWLGLTQGNGDVGKYFTKQFGFGHTTQYSGGFFSTWANSLSNTKGVLLEYPKTTDDFSIVESYATKTFNAIIEIIKSSNGNGGSGSGDGGGSGSGDGNITVGSKVKITGTHWATGQLIPEWAKNTTHTVSKIDGDRALLQEVTSWIYLKDIVLADGSGSGSGSGSGNGDNSFNATGKVINVETNLRVRKTPSTSGEIVGTINANQTVTITHKNGDWYKIASPIVGYVHSDFIQIIGNDNIDGDRVFNATGKVINVTSQLNIRSLPSTDGKVVGTLNAGEVINITHKNGDWYKIALPKAGYVHKDYIAIISGGTDGDIAYNKTGTVINVETNLRVRKTPSTGGEVVGTINANQIVSITHKNGDWYKISSPISGYVHKDYIRVHDDDSNGNGDSNIQNDFMLVKNCIRELRKLAFEYGTTIGKTTVVDINILVLDYLRHYHYNNDSDQWRIAAGVIDDRFTAYAKQNLKETTQKLDVYIKSKKEVKLGTNTIDLAHMAVTTRCYSRTIAPPFWTGWGGDLSTAIGEITYKKNKFNKLHSSIANTIMAIVRVENEQDAIKQNPTFDRADFYSDIDAIYFALNKHNAYIDNLFEKYYLTENLYKNRLHYIKQDASVISITKESIKNSLTGLLGFKLPGKGKDLEAFSLEYNKESVPKDEESINAACEAFVNCLNKLSGNGLI